MGVFVWPWFVGSGGGGGGGEPVLNVAHVQAQINVSTTATPARVGASNLANRKMLLIHNTASVPVFFGTSAVTTTNGVSIFPNQTFTINVGPTLTPHLIVDAGSHNIVVAEFS